MCRPLKADNIQSTHIHTYNNMCDTLRGSGSLRLMTANQICQALCARCKHNKEKLHLIWHLSVVDVVIVNIFIVVAIAIVTLVVIVFLFALVLSYQLICCAFVASE